MTSETNKKMHDYKTAPNLLQLIYYHLKDAKSHKICWWHTITICNKENQSPQGQINTHNGRIYLSQEERHTDKTLLTKRQNIINC